MTELLSHSLFVGRVACPSRCIEPLNPHNHYKRTIIPSPRTITLASLVKGEVLSPERIRATTGGIATPTFRSALTFPKPHYPSKIANTLASLVKGELLLLSFAQPTIEGLLHHPLPRTNPYHTRKQLYPNKPIYNKKIEFQKTCHRHLF